VFPTRDRTHLRALGRVVLSACLAVVFGPAAGCLPTPQTRLAQAGAAVYWCPMHPEVRGRAGERCPKCGMALVPARPSDYLPYDLSFEVLPHALKAGERGSVRFQVREPHTGTMVDKFEILHERVFHLFIVSHDLEYFAHVHPELRADGSLDVGIQLPREGAYRLIADFVPEGAAPQLIERSFTTAGYNGPMLPSSAPQPDLSDKIVGDARVKVFTPPSVAGREQLLTFEFSDARTGAPIKDLEPYLGATAHLLVVAGDLSTAFHSHPVAEITSAVGPEVVFQLVFPRAGPHRVWVQFQRAGVVGTASFTVPVAERP
jgi:hypothetical protein